MLSAVNNNRLAFATAIARVKITIGPRKTAHHIVTAMAQPRKLVRLYCILIILFINTPRAAGQRHNAS